MVKKAPANAGYARDEGLIPESGRSPGAGNGNVLQYSGLKNSMDRGAWQGHVHGVIKSWTQLSTHTHTHTHTYINTDGAILIMTQGNSLAVQWLRLHASIAEGPGSIPGQGNKILQALRHGLIIITVRLSCPVL